MVMVLVLRFNAYSGKLMDGYWMDRKARLRVGKYLRAAECIDHLVRYPDTACLPTEC